MTPYSHSSLLPDSLSSTIHHLEPVITNLVRIWIAERSLATNRELDEKRRQTQMELQQIAQANQRELQKERLEHEALLAKLNRELQEEIAAKQREVTLHLPELNKILENWPLKLFPSQILEAHQGSGPMPLLIVISPPEVDFDRFGALAQSSPLRIEKRLAQGLREFLEIHYSLDNPMRPTELLDGVWDSNRFHGGASIKALFGKLRSEPMLILESEVDGDELNFRIAYWGLGQERYCYRTIISGLPHRDLVFALARHRGADQPDNQDVKAFSQLLIAMHCLIVGWVADAHHLIHHDVPPLLPRLLPHIQKLVPDLTKEIFDEVVKTIIPGYQQLYKALQAERPSWAAELTLDLVQSLIDLPNKSWAKQQIHSSIELWLQQHQVSGIQGVDLLEVMRSFVTGEDRKYVQKLKECFTALEDEDGLDQVEILFNFIGEDYEEAEARQEQEIAESRPQLNISLVRTLDAKQFGIHSLAISPDGQALVCGGFGGEPNSTWNLNIWDLKNGELLHSVPNVGFFNPPPGIGLDRKTLAISPDGKIMASVLGILPGIKIWCLDLDLDNGGLVNLKKLKKLRIGEGKIDTEGSCSSIDISPDGQTLIFVTEQEIHIYLLTDEGYEGQYSLKMGQPLIKYFSVAISPNGQTFACGTTSGTIDVFNLSNGEHLWSLRHLGIESPYDFSTKNPTQIAISSDGKTLVSKMFDEEKKQNEIKIWDLNTGVLLRVIDIDADFRVNSFDICPDGETLICIGFCWKRDMMVPLLKIWNLYTRELRYTLTAEKYQIEYFSRLAISPDGQTLVTADNDKIRVWQLSESIEKIKVAETLRRQRSLESKQKLENVSLANTCIADSECKIQSIAISPDGKTIVSGNAYKFGGEDYKHNTIDIWELDTGKKLRTLYGHSNPVKTVAITPDGQTLLSLDGRIIKVWELNTGNILRTLTELPIAENLTISPNGHTIIGSNYENEIKIWELNTGKEIRTLTGHSDWIRALAISPNGETLVSSSEDKTIKVWEINTGKELHTLTGHSEFVISMVISPNEQMLVSSSIDETIKVWELNTGKELLTFTESERRPMFIKSLSISPNGKILAGISSDCIKIWELNTGKELRTLTRFSAGVLKSAEDIHSVAISPDGQSIISHSDRTIRIWQVQNSF